MRCAPGYCHNDTAVLIIGKLNNRVQTALIIPTGLCDGDRTPRDFTNQTCNKKSGTNVISWKGGVICSFTTVRNLHIKLTAIRIFQLTCAINELISSSSQHYPCCQPTINRSRGNSLPTPIHKNARVRPTSQAFRAAQQRQWEASRWEHLSPRHM